MKIIFDTVLKNPFLKSELHNGTYYREPGNLFLKSIFSFSNVLSKAAKVFKILSS